MKTIKLKIMNSIDLDYELRTYNSVVHFAYNRFHDDSSVKEKDVRSQVNQLFKGKLNSWLLQCAIKEGKAIQRTYTDALNLARERANDGRYKNYHFLIYH